MEPNAAVQTYLVKGMDPNTAPISKYLEPEDLGDDTPIVTIDDIIFQSSDVGDSDDHRLIVFFAEPGFKPLPLGKWNRLGMTIRAKTWSLHKWVGLPVRLRVVQVDGPDGPGTVPVIRIDLDWPNSGGRP